MAWTGLMRRVTLAGAVLLMSATVAHAQYFNYRTQTTTNPTNGQVGSDGGKVFFSNVGTILGYAGAQGTNIVLTNITTNSNAPNTAPETISGTMDTELFLQLADASGNPLSGWISNHFTADLGGTMSKDTANLTVTFTNVSPKVYNFGGLNVFVVVRNPYVPPGPPGPNQPLGAIGAHVNGPLAVPEPGTLAMLFGSGVGGSLFFWRRRRA